MGISTTSPSLSILKAPIIPGRLSDLRQGTSANFLISKPGQKLKETEEDTNNPDCVHKIVQKGHQI